MANKSPYKDKEGMRLPGVTTIVGQELGWNKGVLINWANNKGLEGISTTAYVDNLADIGHLAHQMVLDHIRGVETDTKDFSLHQISKAENCLSSYEAWAQGKTIEPILMEERMISEELKFGGTPDCYAKLDGKLTLLDYKTGGVFDEHLIQVAGGYLILLEENGHKVEGIQLLGIPRTEGDSFQVRAVPEFNWKFCKQIFMNCLTNYKLHKKLKEE